mmetsp:Transcript_15814/g.17569  ORF Transcript_15814/g.17569 Transcript_15814/m.17569 type:complete len:497 (+) Transcript_15814:52-1542(+)
MSTAVEEQKQKPLPKIRLKIPKSLLQKTKQQQTLARKSKNQYGDANGGFSDPNRRYNKNTRQKRRAHSYITDEPIPKRPRTYNGSNGYFTAEDDQLLREMVGLFFNLTKVHKTVKFSRPFTLTQLKNRWRDMLYSEEFDSEREAMGRLQTLKKRVQWSKIEDDVLKSEVGKSGPSVNNFQQVLEKHRLIFHPTRTAKSLEAHYYRLKRSGSLNSSHNSSVPELHPPSHLYISRLPHYSIPKGILEYAQKTTPTDTKESIKAEVKSDNNQNGHTVTELYPPCSLYNIEKTLIDSFKNNIPKSTKTTAVLLKTYKDRSDTLASRTYHAERCLQRTNDLLRPDNVLATLRGIDIYADMKTRSIIIGRRSENNQVDVDLPHESVSDRQMMITIIDQQADLIFVIKNIGLSIIWINGRPVKPDTWHRLHHMSLVEIGPYGLIFDIHTTIFDDLRMQYKKKLVSTTSLSKPIMISSSPSSAIPVARRVTGAKETALRNTMHS